MSKLTLRCPSWINQELYDQSKIVTLETDTAYGFHKLLLSVEVNNYAQIEDIRKLAILFGRITQQVVKEGLLVFVISSENSLTNPIMDTHNDYG